jgi:hypothetical protein
MHNPITFVTYEINGNESLTKEEYIRSVFMDSDRDASHEIQLGFLEDSPGSIVGVGNSILERVNEFGFDSVAHEEFYCIGEYHSEARALEGSKGIYGNPGVFEISFQEFCQVLREYLAEKSA